MSDLLISFDNIDTNHEDKREVNEDKSKDKIKENESANNLQASLIDNPIVQSTNRALNVIKSTNDLLNDKNDENNLQTNDINEKRLEDNLDAKLEDSVELKENEKKKVLQELNRKIIDEQKINNELIKKLHLQLDDAIEEKEELVKKLSEKECDLNEVANLFKKQKDKLKQLEDVESTNSKLKALAVKLKKELAEVNKNVSVIEIRFRIF